MADDYEKLRDWMARPDVRAAVARYEDDDDEEPPQPEQLAMRLDASATGGREGA